MPKLGLTMTEGSVADWIVGASQSFRAGEGIFVVETDKVATEIVAESDGTLLEITVNVGETVPVGTVIGYWNDSATGDGAAAGVPVTSREHVAAVAPAGKPAGERPATLSREPAPEPTAAANRIVASPYARRLAREQGIALSELRGTGPGGRIVARDIGAPAQSELPVKVSVATDRAVEPSLAGDETGYDIITPSARQQTAARRLAQGKQETPHFYLALEAEVSALVALRKEINDADLGVRLTLNHLIVKAVVDALRKHPEMNRVWSQDGILAFRRIDVGVAVDTPAGLLAPAVTDVAHITIRELAGRLNALAERAKAGGLTAADQGTAAITISNAGMHNVTYMTSIINPGQAMILGVGSIKGVFRPDANGQPALRQELGLVLSADHRIIDGVSALKFLNAIVHCLEHPAQLLLH